MKKFALISGILLLLGVLLISGCASSGKITFSGKDFDGKMTIYKSSMCGCCGLYSDYVNKESNLKVNIVSLDDVSSVKNKYNVPENLRSCHIAAIGDYYVEGHVPMEAVVKLMTEKPDIAGIALPGMPAGSPGMPGRKDGDFVIYAINHDGTHNEFMRI